MPTIDDVFPPEQCSSEPERAADPEVLGTRLATERATHLCPLGDGSRTRCCGVLMFELPLDDRITMDPHRVRCMVRSFP